MSKILEFYNSGGTAVVDNIIQRALALGAEGAETVLRIYNTGDTKATNVRIFVRCTNGFYTGQDNEIGQEVVTEKWLQVKEGVGAYKAIGGDFGNQGNAANYLVLSDINASAYITITVKVVLPASVSTTDMARFQLGVSCDI